ncbi:unnamed protein product (mitochondrion) [Plasmodiophora brassicae]|uniref:DUF7920 domain-containing protein n=1 Tax=Plasmodiophora brassicae TaxID=37360 RepID=A0A3P3Y255_PLABS|nr:unnamed protein product [Plasmodiophora brassicae]
MSVAMLTAADYLEWASSQANVRVVSREVRLRRLPRGVQSLQLFDVGLRSRGPDDKLYGQSPVLWARVARGNALLRVQYADGRPAEVRFALQGIRKFTGHDDCDDDDIADIQAKSSDTHADWSKFFVGGAEALNTVATFVATEKENGEAGHLAVTRFNDNEFLVVAGSKNVHLVARSDADLDAYDGDPSYSYALRIARVVFSLLYGMKADARDELLRFMADQKMTANFELVDPSSQHIVLYPDGPVKLLFFAWTAANLDPVQNGLLCPAFPPADGLEKARELGFSVVRHSVFDTNDLNRAMASARTRANSEGSVIYCVDKRGRTVGLWKVKSVWYICQRAIREKIVGGRADGIPKRMDQIGRWLKLTSAEVAHWKQYGARLASWIDKHHPYSEKHSIRNRYAVLISQCEADRSFQPIDNGNAAPQMVIIFAFDASPGLVEGVRAAMADTSPMVCTDDVSVKSIKKRAAERVDRPLLMTIARPWLVACSVPLTGKLARFADNVVVVNVDDDDDDDVPEQVSDIVQAATRLMTS